MKLAYLSAHSLLITYLEEPCVLIPNHLPLEAHWAQEQTLGGSCAPTPVHTLGLGASDNPYRPWCVGSSCLISL